MERKKEGKEEQGEVSRLWCKRGEGREKGGKEVYDVE